MTTNEGQLPRGEPLRDAVTNTDGQPKAAQRPAETGLLRLPPAEPKDLDLTADLPAIRSTYT